MRGCPAVENGADWAAGFRTRAAQKRIPVTAMLELTGRCNLRCQHCYLGDQEPHHTKREKERGTEPVKASLREWAEAGCLYLTITGGDPMMRRDFGEIYQTAVELGMLVTVFSNGTLVTDETIRLFCEYPPRSVEVSVYGATAPVYEAVTQIPGSFEAAWEGIRKLQAAGIRLTLKTMVLTLNQHELERMSKQAEEMGCKFRYDAGVFPCLENGGDQPLSLRVEPEVIVEYDLLTEERRAILADHIEKQRNRPPESQLYRCSAGVSQFFVDPFGNLSPCLLTRHYSCAEEDRRFLDIWENEFKVIRNRTRSGGDNSLFGELQGACTHCPAMNYIETGDEEVESEYMKKTARLRYDTLMK